MQQTFLHNVGFERPLAELGYNLTTILKEHKLLDVGCGTAILRNSMQDSNPFVYGIDSEPYFIKLGKERQNYNFQNMIVANAKKLPFASESFDTIVSITLYAGVFTPTSEDYNIKEFEKQEPAEDFVFGNMKKRQKEIMNEIYRVTKKGGLYLLFENPVGNLVDTLNFTKLYHHINKTHTMILRKD